MNSWEIFPVGLSLGGKFSAGLRNECEHSKKTQKREDLNPASQVAKQQEPLFACSASLRVAA